MAPVNTENPVVSDNPGDVEEFITGMQKCKLKAENFGRLFFPNHGVQSYEDICFTLTDYEMDGNVAFPGTVHYASVEEEEQKNTTDYDDLQIWYHVSPPWRRFTLQMVGILVIALICHIMGFLLAVFWMDNIHHGSNDPYLCETEHCYKVSEFLKETMNTSVNPCDNFYEYVCGNYLETQKAEVLVDKHDYFLLRTLQSDINEREAFGALFGVSKSKMNTQISTFFKSCLNYSARNEIGDAPFLKELKHMGLLDLENPTKNLSQVGYEVWKHIGQTGLFLLNLYINPYDGFKKYLIRDFADRGLSKFFTLNNDSTVVISKEKSKNLYIQDLRLILQYLGVTHYSPEEVHEALYTIMKVLITKVSSSINTRTPYRQDSKEEKNIFNCDVLSNGLDPSYGLFMFQNFLIHFPDGSFNYFGDRGSHFADYICNGQFVAEISQSLDTGKFPNVTVDLAFKSFWIIYVLRTSFDDLSPDTKLKFQGINIFDDITGHVIPHGAECLRSVKTRMPHLVHERLMQVYNVSDDRIVEVENKFIKMHNRFEQWLSHPDRKHTFGEGTLSNFRRVIREYSTKVYNFRFSKKYLQKLGYGHTSTQISEENYLDNTYILRKMMTKNDIQKWRGKSYYFIPLLSHTSFKYAIQEVTVAETYFRPKPIATIIIPALAYSPLYANDDLLSLKYGSMWATLMKAVFETWVNNCDNQDITIFTNDTTVKCTVIEVDDKEEIVNLNSYPVVLDSSSWLDVLIDLLVEMHRTEQLERDNKNIFGYKRLIGMEKYTPEQLLFLKLTRHTCNEDKGHISDVLSGLSRSTSFSAVWKCPVNSIMNAEQKCLTDPEENSHFIR